MDLRNIDQKQLIGRISCPTPAPEYILGSEHYYSWRAEDFMTRCSEFDIPEYYMEYGDKYANRFKYETRPKLSEAGQRWLDRVLRCLQEFMENQLSQFPFIELDREAFTRFAFESHVCAYQTAGFKDLPFQDLILIAFTPDIRDLFRENGRKQFLQLWKAYATDQPRIKLLKEVIKL